MSNRSLFVSMASSILVLLLADSVRAQAISVDSFVEFDPNVMGECQLLIDAHEPFTHLNSDCLLLEYEDELVKRQNANPIAGFFLGDPPRSKSSFNWTTLIISPKPGLEYCNDFGHHDEFVEGECGFPLFMTFTAPSEDIDACGISDCDMKPPDAPTGMAPLISCSGQLANFNIWWDGEFALQSDFFEVERKVGQTYQPFYSGIFNDQTYSTTDPRTDFRVRIVSTLGSTIWAYFPALSPCGGGFGF